MGTSTGRPVSAIVVYAGLFTISWDRFANFSVGSFNVKLPVLLLVLGLLLTAVDNLVMAKQAGRQQPIVAWAGIVLTVYAVVGLAASDVRVAETQTVTVLLGAAVPFATVYWNARIHGNLDQLLTWFIRGGVVASIFGLYQLAAFYVGLPQLVEYEATGGGFGRISAFSYEAAYFGYFLVLVLAATVARARLRQVPVSRTLIVFLVVVLLLANTRAVFFTVPLFLLLITSLRPSVRVRARLLPIIIAGVWAVLVGLLLRPDVLPALVDRATSIFDTTDATSNLPRLLVYNTSVDIIRDHPWLGIGAGNLIDYGPLYGLPNPPGATPNSVIANNAWLQALLDGGWVLLSVQIIFVVVAVVTLYRRRSPVARDLMAGWLSIAIVAFMLTSFFFNSTVWVVLALAAAAAARHDETAPTALSEERGRGREVERQTDSSTVAL